jgi:hypothetical protein
VFVENEVLGKFGVCRLKVPEWVRIRDPETLPEDLPHVVVVSHNVLMKELFGGLYGGPRYAAEWDNACW